MKIFSSYEDFSNYCQAHADVIYVRDQVDGKWGSYALNELSANAQAAHIQHWYQERIVPVMLKEPL